MSSGIEKIISSSIPHGQSELVRVDYLDGWRGLAICFVLQSHFFGVSGIDTGRLGVDIFFVLSGFLMSRILFEKRVPLVVFYKRRITRILPVFLLFVVTLYGIDIFILKTHEWKNFIYTITFLRTYFPVTPNIWHANIPIGHLWSLNVEEHCYIFLSAVTLIRVLKGREEIALILSGVLSIVIHLVYIKYPSIAPHPYGLRTETVASHLLLSAGYYLVRGSFTPFVKPWMPILTFIAAVLCYTKVLPWWSARFLSPFLLAFTINHLSEVPRFLQLFLAYTPMRLLGIWSYSIYLWQQPFYSYKDYVGHDVDFLAIVPAIGVGLLSFYFFEKPIRTWLNNNW